MRIIFRPRYAEEGFRLQPGKATEFSNIVASEKVKRRLDSMGSKLSRGYKQYLTKAEIKEEHILEQNIGLKSTIGIFILRMKREKEQVPGGSKKENFQ